MSLKSSAVTLLFTVLSIATVDAKGLPVLPENLATLYLATESVDQESVNVKRIETQSYDHKGEAIESMVIDYNEDNQITYIDKHTNTLHYVLDTVIKAQEDNVTLEYLQFNPISEQQELIERISYRVNPENRQLHYEGDNPDAGTIVYNKKGQLYEMHFGKVRVDFAYYPDGKIKRIKSTENANEQHFIYNDNNVLTSIESAYINGALKLPAFEYTQTNYSEFDQYGNWQKKVVRLGNREILTAQRQLTYYEKSSLRH